MKSGDELSNLGITFEVLVVSSPVHTVEDVQRMCGCETAEVIKTLVYVGRTPVVVLVAGNRKVDLSRLRSNRDDATVRMASPQEVKAITGYEVGAVSPFGFEGVDLIADDSVRDLDSLIFGSGESNALLKMEKREFFKAFKGSFALLGK